MIKVKVEHFNAWCVEEELLTSGTVGLEVQVEFSPDWSALIPHVVFSNGETELAAVIEKGKTVVPWEVMAKPKHNLRLGVRGLNENGSIVIPTVYADLGQIQFGTADTTDEGREATPSLVGQITGIAQNAENIAQSVRDDADAGKFNGAPGKSPYVGDNGNWFVWDNALKEFVDTGVHAQGEQGLEGKPLQAFAVCYDEAAPISTGANTWYVPKTMPKPTGNVGLMVDVYWVNGKLNDLGYDVKLIWGEPDGADNEIIVDTAGTTDKLTGSHSIPTEGTVRYVLTEANGRKRWDYVSGELIPTQFSTDTAADVTEKVVPGLSIEYLPGMEIYVQMDKGNTAELMKLVDDNGVSLPVYGNGTGAKTGAISAGYILHLKNAGDHWQIINSGNVSKEYVNTTFAPVIRDTLSGTAVAMDMVSPIMHEVECKVESSNIFDINSWFNNSPINREYYKADGNELTIIKEDVSGLTKERYIHLVADETYTLSSAKNIDITIFKTSYGIVNNVYNATKITFKCPNDGIVIIKIFSPDKSYPYIAGTIKIEKGSVATPYTPYVPDMSKVTVSRSHIDGSNLETYESKVGETITFFSLSPDMKITNNVNGVSTGITYNADTKKYIDKKFNELKLAILSRGGNV